MTLRLQSLRLRACRMVELLSHLLVARCSLSVAIMTEGAGAALVIFSFTLSMQSPQALMAYS